MVFCIMWRPRLLGKINLILLTITKGENEIHLFRCMMKCLYYVLTIIWTHHFSFIFKKNYLKNVVFYKMFHIIHFINLLFQNESIVLIQNTKLLLCKLFKIGQNFQEINIYYFIKGNCDDNSFISLIVQALIWEAFICNFFKNKKIVYWIL
jgi:hypothetical protein